MVNFFYRRPDCTVRDRDIERITRDDSRRAPYYFTISPRNGIAERKLARRIVMLDRLGAERERRLRAFERTREHRDKDAPPGIERIPYRLQLHRKPAEQSRNGTDLRVRLLP